jgi:NADH:ubiquinone oxidoreductase subunit 2 (subunit N)
MQFSNLNLDYISILPEIITAIAGVLLMLIDAFSKNGARRTAPLFSIFSLLATLAAIVMLWPRSY